MELSSISVELFTEEIKKQKCHFVGFDKKSRPVLLFLVARHHANEKAKDLMIKFIIFILETSIKQYISLFSHLSSLASTFALPFFFNPILRIDT